MTPCFNFGAIHSYLDTQTHRCMHRHIDTQHACLHTQSYKLCVRSIAMHPMLFSLLLLIVTWTLLSSMVGGGSLPKQVRCASLTDKAKFWGDFFGWVHKWINRVFH